MVSRFLLMVERGRARPLPLILGGRGRGRGRVGGVGCVKGGSVVSVVACMVVSSVSVGRGPR